MKKETVQDFMRQSAKERYSYNFTWLGRPIIQYPQDIIAMQELIWRLKPTLIIETGVAHGGSLIFYASLLELIGEGRVIGVDIDIRIDNWCAIEDHPLANHITLIEGDSLDKDVIKRVHKYANGESGVLVCLDSNHTHEHVLRELEAYAPLVTKDSYVVVFDTIIESLPDEGKPWGKGNNPFTAVREFLRLHPEFEADKSIDERLLISSSPGGYLKRVK